MDASAIFILTLEALFALWLLWRSGALSSRPALVISVLLLALAFAVRGLCLDYVTLDYVNFLSYWVQHFRDAGIVQGLARPVGNYNIPYLYFLALFSLSDINDLYLIKLLSIFFDVLLAYAAMGLASKMGVGVRARLACFFGVLLLPTVVLNGALWGQCDSVYVSLALMSVYLALDGKPSASVLCMTLAFGFKLQAVFIMPVMAVLWFCGKYKLRHFLLFPAGYVALVLPAVLCGRPFMDTLTLYFDQAGSVGSALNYNSPSMYSLYNYIQDEKQAAALGVAAAFTFMALVLYICFVMRRRLSPASITAACLLLALGIPLLLPHMHDRYFFAVDVLTVAIACYSYAYSPAPLLSQFASGLGYHAYLKMRYFLPMSYGCGALLVVLALAFVMFFRSLDGRSAKTPESEAG